MKGTLVSAFALTLGWATPAMGQSLFGPPLQVLLPVQTFGVAVGDVNADGYTDVVTNGWPNAPIFIFYGRADRTLSTTPITIQSQSLTGSLNLADVTGDGRADIVGSGFNRLEVIAQTATGGLAPPVSYPSDFSELARVGDFNSDGRLDVIGLEFSVDGYTNTEEAGIWYQNTAGAMDPQVLVPLPHGYNDDIHVDDIDGDGRSDVVVVNSFSEPFIVVLYQTAFGTMSAPVSLSIGPGISAWQVAVGDMNDDGRKDIVVSYGGYSSDVHLAVFHQNGSGTFAAPELLTAADWLTAIEIADANSDGRDDILLLHQSSLGVILQDASGVLTSETLIALPPAGGHAQFGFVAADINADGATDVAYSQVGSQGALTVLYGNPAPPNGPPVARDDQVMTFCDRSLKIAVLANDSDPDGDTLMITGVSKPSHGSAKVLANGRQIVYDPKRRFRGTDHFTYTISDGRGATASATVTVVVR